MNHVNRKALVLIVAAAVAVSTLPVIARQSQTQTPPPTQTPPFPKPFPGAPAPPPKTNPPAQSPSQPPATTAPPATSTAVKPVTQTPLAPADTAAQAGPPTEATLGVRFYPDAEFLESFDAGRGQRLYVFGTNATYLDVVTFYKTELKSGGRELFKVPATQQFDLDRFQETTMAQTPSVVVKDYTWTGLNGELRDSGYLFVSGTTEKRFKTVIQIVPAGVK